LGAQQKEDFVGILEAMDGCPVTVRLLDPPLHEFLPHITELVRKEARGELHERDRVLLRAAQSWQDVNPMLGTRGVRLGILKPSLYRMQVRALMDAAAERKQAGGNPIVEIMIPLTVTRAELALVTDWVREEADGVLAARGVTLDYLVGTMIETPRAALVADEIAEVAEFFSFGTNDLTQTTLGLSRDDAGRFLPAYVDAGIFPDDPFQVLDTVGVGRLIRLAVEDGRTARPGIKLGICGEHGGEPRSVAFCHAIGLDYVSCSPYRVPIARLAAAHAALEESSER
jgi:pyruvate,orthophosphate dikinase